MSWHLHTVHHQSDVAEGAGHAETVHHVKVHGDNFFCRIHHLFFACDTTSTSRLPYPYLPLVHVTECGFISHCNAIMQCFRVSECLPADWTSSYSVQCVHFCCLLHLAMTGTIQSGQSKSQTLLKILKEIYVTFGHFSHLPSVFKKNFCVCFFCLQNLSKKPLSSIFCHLNF